MSTTASTQTHQTLSTHRTTTTSHRGKAKAKAAGAKTNKRGVGLCGPCVQSFEIAAERAESKEKERKGPKSWFERKFAVGIVLGLFGWSNYVFWGVILSKTWVGAEDALVGFAAGVVLTIVYGVLTLMFLLTYLKILLTPPGFAKDYVQPSDPPLAPEPPPLAYTHAYNPIISSSHAHNDIYDGTSEGGEPIVYPPSRKAPTSEYNRHSMEGDRDGDYDDRITHQSISLDDHGEFEADENLGRSDTWLHEGTEVVANGSEPLGVPYEMMPTRPLPVHTRSRSASIVPIPPSTPKAPTHAHQRSHSTTYPPSPTTPTTTTTKAKPALLRKNSKRGSVETPSTQDNSANDTGKPRPNKLVRLGSTNSRGPALHLPPPISKQSPTTPTGIKPPMSPTSRSPTTTPTPMAMATGFHYESTSYILDPPRPSQSQTSHTRTRSYPHARHGNATSPFDTPTDARTPTPGLAPSTTHSHSHSRRASPPLNERPIPYQDERPVPYLDDLPPIAPATEPASRWDRKPSDKPVLEPYYRYCSRDGIVKPPRCHHCRICNTCVLGYDHHCPWVGGCVGAQNRKFFVVFTFWSTIYLVYTLALLIATIASRSNSSRPITFTTASLDPNIVVLLIVTVLFLTFSAGMLGTHIHLLRHNASTVEWHGIQGMRERERAVVSQLVPVCECLGMGEGEPGNGGLLGRKELGWKDEEIGVVKEALPKGFKGRVELRKKWDNEWGRIGKEGNLWWLGSNRVNWEAVMGKNPWTWFLPVGNVAGVGVDYPCNPRFDEQGRWMKRSNWPEELR